MSPGQGTLDDATSLPSKVTQAPAGPSRRLLNTAARIAAAAAVRNTGEDAQVLGFTPRDFVIFGLPYKNPKTSLYVRRNGALTFTITGGTHGVPYAQDRLLVIWLATVFKVCGSPETNAIAFDSLREVARSLGKASSGQQRQRIEAGFLRLFDATFLASDSRPNAIRRERYQLMQRMRLWKEDETRQPNQHTLWPNVLLYDPVFANDIRTGAIPTDFQSVLALSENMGPLSLYQFEAHNSYLHARFGKGGPRGPGARLVGAPGADRLRREGERHAQGAGDDPALARHREAPVAGLPERARARRHHPDGPGWVRHQARDGCRRREEFGVRPLDRLALERMRENPWRPAVDREQVFRQSRNG